MTFNDRNDDRKPAKKESRKINTDQKTGENYQHPQSNTFKAFRDDLKNPRPYEQEEVHVEKPLQKMHPHRLIIDGPSDGPTVLLAHDYNDAMDLPHYDLLAEHLSEQGIRCVRFEFAYMHQRRRNSAEKEKYSVDNQSLLKAVFQEAMIATNVPFNKLFIAGKGLGAKVGSFIADELEVAGLIAMSYPFHPIGVDADRKRIQHFEELKSNTLLIQGTSDPMGSRYDLGFYRLAVNTQVFYVEDSDADFTCTPRGSKSQSQNIRDVAEQISRFVKAKSSKRRRVLR